MDETKITATELARNLSDILNRVRYKGERFKIERNGETVAILEPSPATKRFTNAGEFFDWFVSVPPPDEDFWKDVEEVHNSQGVMPPPPEWPS